MLVTNKSCPGRIWPIYLWVFTANKPGHAALTGGSEAAARCLGCYIAWCDIWHMITRPGHPGSRAGCQLINLIRTSLQGESDSAKTTSVPLLSGDTKNINQLIFRKHISGCFMTINGMAGSLFVKVFWSPRRAVYLNLPILLARVLSRWPVTSLSSPVIQSFMTF